VTAKPILIVDDTSNILLTVSKALEKLGLGVETTAYAEDALLRLSRGEYSIVLLDLELWGMGGLEMLKRVREKWPDLPVLIITAYGTPEAEEEARSLGAAGFVVKPFSPREIRERVAAVLGLSERRPGPPSS
jgi:DNA-binding response OmpR family regulator